MAKSESDIFTPRTGQVIQAENGTQYFVCGNNRIKISEHFAAGGKGIKLAEGVDIRIAGSVSYNISEEFLIRRCSPGRHNPACRP